MLQATDKAYVPSVTALNGTGTHAITGREVTVSQETVERGSRKVTEKPLPFFPTLRRALKSFWQGVNIGWMGFLYQWRKARKRHVPYSARVTVTDPIVRIAEDEGIELPQDDPHLVLYRTEKGVYFTESHMQDKAWCAKHLKGTATFACDISEERASQLVDYLEAAKMDTMLKPEDEHLLTVLKRLLAEKDVY